MSYYPYYNYGYMPPNMPPCSDSNIQYQGQQGQQSCPTDIKYYEINGCQPFNPCSLDTSASSTGMTGTIPYLNTQKTAYTSSENFYFDADAHQGLGKLVIKGGLDPIYVNLVPQSSNPLSGTTGTVWYDTNDGNMYIDDDALIKNNSEYIKLKRHTTNPNAGQTGTIWIKEAANGDKSLYIDDKIVSGGAGNAASSGGLGLGATGTSVTLFPSVINPKPVWITEQNPGTLWVNPQGSLMFNESQVIGPAGTALYATDPWITKYMLGQPPIPIQQPENKQTLVANGTATPNSEYSSTTTDIDIRWTPPEQRYIGLIDTAIPVIKEFQIRVIDSTVGTPITTVILDTRTVTPAIRAAVLPTKLNRLLINKSSTATPSEILTPVTLNGVSYTTLKWYKGATALVEPLRVELWYENSGNYDNVATPAIPYNKLSINEVRFSPPGPPSRPLVTSVSNATDTTISINLSVPLAINSAGGGYTDRYNLNNDSPIKYYNIYYRAISTRKTSGINTTELNILNVPIILTQLPQLPQLPQSTLANNYLVNYTITGLNPVTTYEVQITARSDALQTTESDRSTAIQITTIIPAPVTTSQIENINLANNFTAIYKDNAYNPITNTQVSFTTTPILSTNIEWFLNLGPVYISLEPETTYSKIKVTLDAQDNTYDILDTNNNVPHILYGDGITAPVVGGIGSLTNPLGIKIELYNGNTSNSGTSYTNTTIVDPNSVGAASGLYLQSYFGIKGKIPGFGASSILNTLLIGLITGRNSTTLNTINKSVNFYIDSLPITEKPIFLNIPGSQVDPMVLQNTSLSANTINICGLGLNNGNWQLQIANIRTKHVIYYFYNNPILEYKFANMPDFTTLLGNPTPTEISTINAADGTVILYPLLPGNTPPINGKTISGTENAFKYLPTISIKANNINKLNANNTTTVEYPIKMIIDPASVYAVANNLSNSTLMNAGSAGIANTFVKGQRMLTSRKSNLYNFITDYRTCRHIFDNTNCILGGTPRDINASPWDSSTDPIIYAANDLQLMNGKFMSRGYSGLGGAAYQGGLDSVAAAYQNYSVVLGTPGFATPDYSGLRSETKYRYVTLRWQYTAAKISGLEFRINGIDSATDLTFHSLSGLYIGTDSSRKQIKFFYRIEQPDIAGTSIQVYSTDGGNDLINGNPSNIVFSQSNGYSFSTPWINANSTYNNDDFSRYAGIVPDNTVTESTMLGGLNTIDDTKIIILGTKPNQSVTYIVTTPIFDLTGSIPIQNRYVNIYAMIGIPMDADFAFTDIDCKVKNNGVSTIPPLTGGKYINEDIGIPTTLNNYSNTNVYVASSSNIQVQSSDIIIRDTGSIQTITISPTNSIYVSPDSQTLTSRINASLTNLSQQQSTSQIVYDINQDVQADNTPIITTSTDGVITLTNQTNQTNPAIVDAYAGGLSSQKGYYMLTKINLGVTLNSGSGVQIVATNDVYPITLSQTYRLASDSSDTTKSRIINLYVDKLPTNAQPNISSFAATANGQQNMQHISGVRVNNGNWSVAISNVATTNTVYYFYKNPILQYTFRDNPIQNLLTSTSKTSSTGAITFFNTGTTPAEIPQVISSSTQVQTYVYRPTITLTANNINTSNNTFTTPAQNIEMILDYPSVILVTQTLAQGDVSPGLPSSAATATISTATYGIRMKTSTLSYPDTTPITYTSVTNNVLNILNDYNTYRNVYDNEYLLTGNALNDLQIVNGAFITPPANDKSYIDYSAQGGPDYSNIRTTMVGKYRWATFRWQFTSTAFQATRLEFYIDNISLGSGYTIIRGNSDTGGTDTVSLYVKNTLTSTYYNLQLYYRFEQPSLIPPSGGNGGDPYNVMNSQGDGSISSIWINAFSNNNYENVADLLAIRAYSGLLGGIRGIDGDMSISQTQVKINVSTPTLNLQPNVITDKKINIYALIGLPMEIPITFKGLKCNVYT